LTAVQLLIFKNLIEDKSYLFFTKQLA